MFRKIICFICFIGSCMAGHSQITPWSVKMANKVVTDWGPGIPGSWNYEKGLLLKSLEKVYERTGDIKYYQNIKGSIDYLVDANGNISTYNPNQYNIDMINMGRSLLYLYTKTSAQKYKSAALKVRNQLLTHPRTSEGGFWHKQIYPNQMWLDGLYMGQPFYAEYSGMFNEPLKHDDVANQIILMEMHARNTTSGLLYHGWDESKKQLWSDPVTGCSPNFWGRALGWYAMSLVDVLDYFPVNHSKRDTIINILERLSTAILKYQDINSGVWYQVVDKGSEPGNYLEASASCMFVYALAKGARKGYLDKTKSDAAIKGYNGILNAFVTEDTQGVAHLNSICKVAGLGGSPYRDGSYTYYIGEPIVQNDPKGIGPFIMASVEIEIAKENIATGMTQEKQYTVSVSPNPANDILYVNIPGQQTALTLTILNSMGHPLFSGNSPAIDMSGWSPGIYYMKIQDFRGIVVQKIVKQ